MKKVILSLVWAVFIVGGLSLLMIVGMAGCHVEEERAVTAPNVPTSRPEEVIQYYAGDAASESEEGGQVGTTDYQVNILTTGDLRLSYWVIRNGQATAKGHVTGPFNMFVRQTTPARHTIGVNEGDTLSVRLQAPSIRGSA